MSGGLIISDYWNILQVKYLINWYQFLANWRPFSWLLVNFWERDKCRILKDNYYSDKIRISLLSPTYAVILQWQAMTKNKQTNSPTPLHQQLLMHPTPFQLWWRHIKQKLPITIEKRHKAMSRANLILKSFHSRDRTLLTTAFCTYIRTLLEYCSSAWSPHTKYLINKIEKVGYSVILQRKLLAYGIWVMMID